MTDILAFMANEIGITRRSDWLLVDQSMIDQFSEVTFDRQFIYNAPARAAQPPFGGTIAHGFLTLSLLSWLVERVRLINPVRSGGEIGALSTITAVTEKAQGRFQQTCEVVVEIKGVEKPALTATWLRQFMT